MWRGWREAKSRRIPLRTTAIDESLPLCGSLLFFYSTRSSCFYETRKLWKFISLPAKHGQSIKINIRPENASRGECIARPIGQPEIRWNNLEQIEKIYLDFEEDAIRSTEIRISGSGTRNFFTSGGSRCHFVGWSFAVDIFWCDDHWLQFRATFCLVGVTDYFSINHTNVFPTSDVPGTPRP